jgi:amicyanin
MNRMHFPFALIGLALAGALAAAACFSEHSATAPNTTSMCSVPIGSGAEGSTLVAIRSFAFQTPDVRIKAGTSVTWVDCEDAGTAAHTTTSDQGIWASPLLVTGEAFTVTFNTPGVFPYHCDPHPFMTGTVTVE